MKKSSSSSYTNGQKISHSIDFGRNFICYTRKIRQSDMKDSVNSPYPKFSLKYPRNTLEI